MIVRESDNNKLIYQSPIMAVTKYMIRNVLVLYFQFFIFIDSEWIFQKSETRFVNKLSTGEDEVPRTKCKALTCKTPLGKKLTYYMQ